VILDDTEGFPGIGFLRSKGSGSEDRAAIPPNAIEAPPLLDNRVRAVLLNLSTTVEDMCESVEAREPGEVAGRLGIRNFLVGG
jgi:hypothetical protein